MTDLVVTTPEALSELIQAILSDFQAAGGSLPPRKWLTLPEAAEYLRVTEGSLRNWVSDRKVPYSKAGGKVLFSQKALDDWLVCST